LGRSITSEHTPADRQDRCLQQDHRTQSVLRLPAIYFWRALGWNKKRHAHVIADMTAAIRLTPDQATCNLPGFGLFRQR